MGKPLYVGVFLTPEARQLLLSLFPPIHPEVTADHLTIKFKPTDMELENLPLGRKVRLKVECMFHDEKGQAVATSGFPSDNAHPHITISFNKEKGGSGKYSNELLSRERNVILTPVYQPAFAEEVILDGVIDVFPRSINQGEVNG